MLDKGQDKSRFIFIRQKLLRVKNLHISNTYTVYTSILNKEVMCGSN